MFKNEKEFKECLGSFLHPVIDNCWSVNEAFAHAESGENNAYAFFCLCAYTQFWLWIYTEFYASGPWSF